MHVCDSSQSSSCLLLSEDTIFEIQNLGIFLEFMQLDTDFQKYPYHFRFRLHKNQEKAELNLLVNEKLTHQQTIERIGFETLYPFLQDDICDPVRCFANLPEHTPLLTILDFPEQKVYICEEKQNITTEIVSKFVKEYLNETLPSQPIRQSSGDL